MATDTWLNALLDRNPNWEQHLGDELAPTILDMATHDGLDLTEDAVHELLGARANRGPARPDGSMTPSEAFKLRMKQLNKRMVNGRWQCPGHVDEKGALHVTVTKGGNLLLRCHGRRAGHPKGCTTDELLAALDWQPSDLFHPDNRPSGPSVELDLFGHVHYSSHVASQMPDEPSDDPSEGPCVPEGRANFVRGQEGTAHLGGTGETDNNRTFPLVHLHPLAARLRSGEAPLGHEKRPSIEQLEERLARGELKLDETLVSGPLPANPCSPRRAELHRRCRDLMLHELRLYAAAGEYRAQMVARSHAAPKLGISDTIARRVLQDLVTVVDGVSTFCRQAAPRQGVRRGTYLYYLPSSSASVARLDLDSDAVAVELAGAASDEVGVGVDGQAT